jgi:hypothetical protein
MMTLKQKREAQIKAEKVAQKTRDLIGCELLPPKLKGLSSAQSHLMTSEQAIARSKTLDKTLMQRTDERLQEIRGNSGDVT